MTADSKNATLFRLNWLLLFSGHDSGNAQVSFEEPVGCFAGDGLEIFDEVSLVKVIAHENEILVVHLHI